MSSNFFALIYYCVVQLCDILINWYVDSNPNVDLEVCEGCCLL